MNDTTNRQAIQHEETTSNTVNAASVATSNASTSSVACPNHSQAVLSSSTSQQQQLADEEEQVVTSTSNENSGTTPYHQTNDFPDLALHSFITSPARITSSTGNDYSSSPIQQVQAREDSAQLLLSSEDDSSEQHQAATTLAQARELHKRRLGQQEDSNIFNAAMPTTSAAAAASSAIVSKNKGHDNAADETAYNHLALARRKETGDRRGINNSDKNSGSLVRSSIQENQAAELTPPNMVARDIGNNLAGTGSSAEQSDNHVEKIILKLPKSTQPLIINESQQSQYQTRQQQQQQQQQRREQEHLLDNDPSMSNSCSNSSTNSSITAEADTRKVEPLKINLHHGSHHQLHQFQHHSPSSSSSTANVPHVIPKITIKPLFKKSSEGNVFENANSDTNAADIQSKQCSDPAPSNTPIPKLTIKAASLTSLATGSSCTVSMAENTSSEPHIVPKLTIRAAHEEGGCTHTSVVPKLTIKISDTQTHNSLHSPPTAKVVVTGVALEPAQQPPLPKLTIKTTLHGASGSSIMSSSISPASSSSQSSSSAASSPQSVVSSLLGGASTSALVNTTSVPKLTIKTLSKNQEESQMQPIVPKLTIKTSASGSCVTQAEGTIPEVAAETEASGGSATGNKIPKLTIKTGQEHAVIITQHKNDQTIPKLTIKTKSIDLEDALSETNKDAPPPEKIPKLTIKAPSAESVPPIPKLTISTPHSPKSHSASLVVRQVTATASPTSTHKIQSPDRLPKLMISRQDVSANYSAENLAEKTVPKLTIKTTSSVSDLDEEAKEKSVKIPKLTIKNLPPPPKEMLQSSEDSEDGTSVESGQSPLETLVPEHSNKMVPKLTITNLGSPKLKLKTILGEKSSTEKLPSNETPSLGHKKSLKANVQTHLVEQNQSKNEEKAPPNVVANGESSSSQEFCGFTENTSDSPFVESQASIETTKTTQQTGTKTDEEALEVRRASDDMDIDEGLKDHDPKIFKNLTHFSAIRNGEAYGIHVDNNLETLPTMPGATNKSPKAINPSEEVVDMVDLTSSPSPGSSPARFDYTDADPKVPEFLNSGPQPAQNAAANSLLIECLQRETSVIQTVPRITTPDVRSQVMTPKEKSNSLLLSQLTAPLRYPPPPPLQPRPLPHLFNATQSALTQFTERLMANGAHSALHQHQQQQHQLAAQPAYTPTSISATPFVPPINLSSHQSLTSAKPPATVIDSIEILDTPEGSPRSSQDDSQSGGEFSNHLRKSTQQLYTGQAAANSTEDSMLHHNNNITHSVSESRETNHNTFLKRSAKELANFTNDCLASFPQKMRRTENLTPTMATLTILTNDNATNSATIITTSPTIIGGSADNHCVQSIKSQKASPNTAVAAAATTPHHRARKQKHDNILNVPVDEMDQVDVGAKPVVKQNVNCAIPSVVHTSVNTPNVVTPAPKKRGRPRKYMQPEEQLSAPPVVSSPSTPNLLNCSAADRRVQLLRKRLAIDMVSADQHAAGLDASVENCDVANPVEDAIQRRERAVRTTRRCGTPSSLSTEKQPTSAVKQRKSRITSANAPSANCDTVAVGTTVASFNHFGGSNSSLSSACSSNSSYATTVTTTATAATAFMGPSNLINAGPINCSFSMSSQIDLTMSSSSSTCSGSTTATLTTVEANGRSMLPPTKALSSTDPLPDVVFQTKDFSAIMLTQQFNSMQSSPSSRKSSRANSQDGDDISGSIGSGSGDDSTSLTSPVRTPGRGRGRGRGRGLRGGPRAHRLGRGASAVAKAIAMSRPRCVGGLKHTPDPERMKGLFTPSPQVFEEDTRMSADMNQTQMNSEPHTPIRQPDFLTNEDESQSSIISNTSASILNPNTIAAVQNGASVKRTKKKKMEVCAADETEYTVSSIAEYDWPPPKGCCPSKNRDTFMIQEQVANYLGIKSFKRKYPDLPRRQIDMEERNWLQEKGLVSEKMCDLGITAVWASDILDIMYADFYEKYEEYKDFVRQKHLREIEAKQKSLGLNIGGRGLQVRDRAMLSASKWNSYFNKTRKDERPHCLDLQNLMVNVPLPTTVPATTIMNRSIADEIAKAASLEKIAEPPTLLKPPNLVRQHHPSLYYPLAVVPGQYANSYKSYSDLELRALPLNTVIDGPLRKEIGYTTTAEDTDSTSETCTANEALSKRIKIRRSRRSRSERSSKENCDSKSEQRSNSRQSETIRLSAAESAIDSDSATDSCTESSRSSVSSSSCTDTATSDSSSEEESETDPVTITCSVCQRTQHKNLKDVPELFINCYTCRRKVHPSCIEMPHRMAVRVRNYNWQCADCKCCIKCKRKQEPNKMLYCEQCDRGYHIYCLGVKSVPDGRWSCERCSVCMRCGATKPEGLPQQQVLCSPNGEKVKQVKHKKVKWINEYRIDHITKLREHCSMLCVPCGRSRTTAKRVQISTAACSSQNVQGNSIRNSSLSPGCSSSTQQHQQQQQQHSPQMKSQLSPATLSTSTNFSSITGINSSTTSTVASSALTSNTSIITSVETASPSPPPVVA